MITAALASLVIIALSENYKNFKQGWCNHGDAVGE